MFGMLRDGGGKDEKKIIRDGERTCEVEEA
jgi:hypothetical protein